MCASKVIRFDTKIIKKKEVYIEKLFSYDQAGKIQTIRKYGELLLEEYRDDGIFVKAYLPKELYQRMEHEL